MAWRRSGVQLPLAPPDFLLFEVRMEEEFNFLEIEEKWRKQWENSNFYKADDFSEKPKFYILVMFPYLSGSGLHVGHCRNYIPADVIARYKRMKGFNVLHPIGFDAFGLPAENYAIEHHIHPGISTKQNIETFTRQLKSLGLSYDWERMFSTSDISYYKWTEWFFEFLYKRGLAYQDRSFQWWCPSCKTVLANEQIIDGRCWRCNSLVEKKELKQWFFKITDYSDRLLEDLDKIDWPERIKLMQKNWIGKSEGAEIIFKGVDKDGNIYDIPVFTTRIDTIFGVTFLAMAPEHPLIPVLTTDENRKHVEDYVDNAMKRIEIERLSTEREKTGEFLGSYAINPISGEKVPIFVCDYVVYAYGTGAVMGVPAHDERDFGFAQRYRLPIKFVISPDGNDFQLDTPYVTDGILINSGRFSKLTSEEARVRLLEYVEENGIGKRATRYKMRDWLISRQRYWGAPIPIIHCPVHGAVPVPQEELPVVLPDEVDFSPRDTGESPLANDEDFVNTKCPICGLPSKRETDTQDGFACSSWYFMRFADPHNDRAPFDNDKVDYWLPVDLYIGGAEHAVMHLLYSRFYTKVLYDAGVVNFDEPFKKLLNQGVILGPDHYRMSKSRGNVINPDDMIREYGADTLRTYILFIGPFDQDAAWSSEGINGVSRFLKRVWKFFNEVANLSPSFSLEEEREIEGVTDKFTQKITNQVETFRFNTMISSFMEWLNYLYRVSQDRPDILQTKAIREACENFIKMLAPSAPFIAEEIWHRLGHEESIHKSDWPSPRGIYREEKVTIVVEINGKVKDKVEAPFDSEEDEVKEIALSSDRIKKLNIDVSKAKFIYVKNRLLNIVVQ